MLLHLVASSSTNHTMQMNETRQAIIEQYFNLITMTMMSNSEATMIAVSVDNGDDDDDKLGCNQIIAVMTITLHHNIE